MDGWDSQLTSPCPRPDQVLGLSAAVYTEPLDSVYFRDGGWVN
jgi:hypothetical protein